MRKILALIAFAATALFLGGCHYGTYGFNYSSGYSPGYYDCDPVVVYEHHHHWRGHRGWRHCH